MGILHARYRAGLYHAVPFLLFAAGLQADSTCYEISGYYDQFGTVDLTTGGITTIATEYSYRYLGVYNGSLYTANSGVLYTVNTSSGSLAQAENDFGVHVADLGSTLSGLYAVGYGTGDGSSSSDLGLYSVDPSTGLATRVGLTGLSNNGDIGLSTNSSALYFGDANELYTIATATGAVTLVGSFGTGANLYEMGGMTTVNGVLYGGDVNNLTIDTINTLTGAATPGHTSVAIYGLAPDPVPSGGSATQEPGSWSLLVAGVAGLMLAKRGRNSWN